MRGEACGLGLRRGCKDVAARLVAQPRIIASSLWTLHGAAAWKEGRNRTAWSFRWPAAGGNEQCGGQRTEWAADVIFSKSAIFGMNLNVTTHGRQQTQNKPVILAIVYDAVAAARLFRVGSARWRSNGRAPHRFCCVLHA